MSETKETTTALDRIREWREEYRLGLSPSPLEDVTQLGAQLDLTHAHPSGIAQLFASGHVTLDSLFRDNGMLRAAGRRVERVLDDQEAKNRISGVGELSLVVGVALWKGNQMPVLMYPVEVRKEGRTVEDGTVIAFTGRVRLNAAFVAAMRENNVVLDESKLFDGSNYESGTPETSAVFSTITARASTMFPDFEIERHIILGCFMDPSSQMLVESQQIIDQLAQGPTGNTVLDALVGRIPDSAVQSVRCRPARRIRDRRCRQHRPLCGAACRRRPFGLRRQRGLQQHRRAIGRNRLPLRDGGAFRAVRAVRDRSEASFHADDRGERNERTTAGYR